MICDIAAISMVYIAPQVIGIHLHELLHLEKFVFFGGGGGNSSQVLQNYVRRVVDWGENKYLTNG